MTGLIWFVQVVHYPLYNKIAVDSFAIYETIHCQITTLVVGPPMIVEALTAILLVYQRPKEITAWLAVLGFFLVAIIWLATLIYSIPNHAVLSSGFDKRAYQDLCDFNWIRTIAWSLRTLLLSFWLYKMLPKGDSAL